MKLSDSDIKFWYKMYIMYGNYVPVVSRWDKTLREEYNLNKEITPISMLTNEEYLNNLNGICENFSEYILNNYWEISPKLKEKF